MMPLKSPAKSDTEVQLRFCKKKLQEKNLTEKVLRYENNALRAHTEFLENEVRKLSNEVKTLQKEADLSKILTFEEKILKRCLRLGEKLFFPTLKGAYRKWKFYKRCGKRYVFSEDFRKFLLLRQNAEKLASDTCGISFENIPLTTLVLRAGEEPWHLVAFMELLYSAPVRVPFEVLVIPGQAKAFPGSLAKLYPGVRIAGSGEKEALLKAARGEYLLFARDETPLLPGCLEELAATLFAREERNAAVPRFYSALTGELLESGLRLCRNGEVIFHGGTEKSSSGEEDYLRECDSFGRFTFIIKRKSLEELPLDPADFTDNPLAFGAAVTANNVKLHLAPRAKALCTAEGEACPVDESWKERYGSFLSERKYGSRDEFASSPFGRRAVLYIDAEIPRGDRGSGALDALFFMEYMVKRGYHVLFFGENTPHFVPKYTPILQRMGVECFTAGREKFKEYLRTSGHLFEFVFVSRVYQAQNFDLLIRKYLPQAAYIFNTVDVHFIREQREAELKKSQELSLQAFMTEKLELNLMSRADAVIVISAEEKRVLETTFGMENVFHIPQARKIFGRTAPPHTRSGALFIGSAHSPNADALKYYTEEILPRLLERNVPCMLTVIGEELHQDILKNKEMQTVAANPFIRWAGFVEDPGELFENARVAIAPLRYGAGTKGKVATAMAYGVPCVATSCGAEGTNMQDGKHLLVRDGAGNFASAMAELMADDALWTKISDGGFDFLRENYAFPSVEKQMDDVLNGAREHHKLHALFWHRTTRGNMVHLQAQVNTVPRYFEALRTLQHDRYAPVFCETAENITQGEIVPPCLKTGSSIFQEEERYSYILFTAPFKGSIREKEALSYALELLYEGGRIIMPCPEKEVEKEMLEKFLFEELDLQKVAFSPHFNLLCLTKVLSAREGRAEW